MGYPMRSGMGAQPAPVSRSYRPRLCLACTTWCSPAREDVQVNDDMVKVLRHLAEHFAPPAVHRLNAPFEVTGLAFQDRVVPALRRLPAADPPYVTGVEVAQKTTR